MIFIAGYHASGKSVVADVLKSEFACLHVESSDITRGLWRESGQVLPIHEWAVAETTRYGEGYIDSIIANRVNDAIINARQSGDQFQDVVFTGARSRMTIQAITDAVNAEGSLHRPTITIGVVADYETLYTRYRSRDRRDGDASIADGEFRKLIEGERNRGLDRILETADFLIDNNGNEQDFLDTTHQILRQEIGLDYIKEYGQDYTDGRPETRRN
jgi:dephospho-CoA kinase